MTGFLAILVGLLFLVGSICWCIANVFYLKKMLDERKAKRIMEENAKNEAVDNE